VTPAGPSACPDPSLKSVCLSAVSNAIPGAGGITKAAAPMLGGSPLSSLADVQGVFSKLGMSPETVSKFAPILSDQVGKVAGPQVAGLLGGLFK
jgi:uncharacterized protein VcgC/VcgE DUF2780